eukprot:scaffold20086_cov157-Isochrysis_galbana.AAC.2
MSSLRKVLDSSSPMAGPDSEEYRTHRPSTPSTCRFCAAYAPATGSSTTLNDPVGESSITFAAHSPSVRTAPPTAPCATQSSSFCFEPTVTTGVAPSTPATICMAASPTPDEAAWIKTTSPGFTPAVSTTSWYAVSQASAIEPASAHDRCSGIRITVKAETDTYSAYPPPGSSAITRSPGLKLAPLPLAATSPAHSRPSTSVVPGGGLARPFRCTVSSRLIDVVRTRISTSPAAGTGVGHAFSTTSLPSRATTAIIVEGTAGGTAARCRRRNRTEARVAVAAVASTACCGVIPACRERRPAPSQLRPRSACGRIVASNEFARFTPGLETLGGVWMP